MNLRANPEKFENFARKEKGDVEGALPVSPFEIVIFSISSLAALLVRLAVASA